MFPTLLVFIFCNDKFIDTKVYISTTSQCLSQEYDFIAENSETSHLDDLYVPGKFAVDSGDKPVEPVEDHTLPKLQDVKNNHKEPLLEREHISLGQAIKVLWGSKVISWKFLISKFPKSFKNIYNLTRNSI